MRKQVSSAKGSRWERTCRKLISWIVCAVLVQMGCSTGESAKEAGGGPLGGAGAQTSEEPAESNSENPSRIIVLIGDGMGAAAIRGAQYVSKRPLAMVGMERLNFLTTHSHEYVTTDSAASATAFATGEKTHYEGVSVEPGTTAEEEGEKSRQLETVLEVAEERKWKTGLVATARIVHATPAAFAAHRANRNNYEGIARDMATSGVDVLLGGGRRFFTDREDGANLLQNMRDDGYETIRSVEGYEQAVGSASRLAGLMYPKDAPRLSAAKDRKLSLVEKTRGALEVLDRNNEEGFFLMVEGSQIDWRGHGLAGRGTVRETVQFDRAVEASLEYARSRDDTLVVVASDHETGGLSMLDERVVEPYEETLGGAEKARSIVDYPEEAEMDESAPRPVARLSPGSSNDEDGATTRMVSAFGHLSMASRGSATEPSEFWSIHTPEMVPFFAEGPGADDLVEAQDNAQVGRRLKQLADGEVDENAEEQDEASPGGPAEDLRPENAVLFVGDGVGLDALTATHYLEEPLSMRRAPVRGLARVRGDGRPVPDEAAAGASLVTGTDDGEAGRVASVLKAAEESGYQTGVVTTGELTNATLAPLFTGSSHSREASKVVDDLVALEAGQGETDGVELAYGGGKEVFGGEKLEALRDREVDVRTEWSGPSAADQVVRLLADGPLASARKRSNGGNGADGPTLREMTERALQKLSSEEDPFLLVVEADGPERLQNSLTRTGELVDEVAEFDRAVDAGLSFAEADGETLVIATADADKGLSVFDNHYGFADDVCGAAARCGGDWELTELDVAVGSVPDTGGFTATDLQGEYAPPRLFLEYPWIVREAGRRAGPLGTNSANPVPVYAHGPWAKRLESGIDQTDIGELLMDWASEPPTSGETTQ